MTPVGVTFDSNVWEHIVDARKRAMHDVCERLHDEIVGGRIAPYLFEGSVLFEGIRKMGRKAFIAAYGEILPQRVGERAGLRRNTDPPELSAYHREHIPLAASMGFRLLLFRRVWGPASSFPEDYFATDSLYSVEERVDRIHECAKFIENLGAGVAVLMGELSGPKEIGIVPQTRMDTNLDDKRYAKGVAEWQDGDALAAHFGYGYDYFCTNDQARSFGIRSVFSSANREKLEARFGVAIVSPEELLARCQHHRLGTGNAPTTDARGGGAQ